MEVVNVTKEKEKKFIERERQLRMKAFSSPSASAWYLFGTTISFGNPEVGLAFVDRFVRKKKNKRKK